MVPYELTWLMILALPDALRKLFKLNAHAVSLVLCELDFWMPFVTTLLASYFASASFAHESAFVATTVTGMISYTVNVLLGKLHNKERIVGRSELDPEPDAMCVCTLCFASSRN